MVLHKTVLRRHPRSLLLCAVGYIRGIFCSRSCHIGCIRGVSSSCGTRCRIRGIFCSRSCHIGCIRDISGSRRISCRIGIHHVLRILKIILPDISLKFQLRAPALAFGSFVQLLYHLLRHLAQPGIRDIFRAVNGIPVRIRDKHDHVILRRQRIDLFFNVLGIAL